LEKNYGARPDIVLGADDAKEVSEANITVGENKSFEVNEIKITCIPVPCHTRGSLLYFLEDKENLEKHNDLTLVQKEGVTTYRGVFTGDTHFIAGCGKFFEGNAEEMHKNLTILGELPKDTFIYPGHEYTVSNLKWAMGIEWENEAYGEKLKWAEEKRAKDEYTVPSIVAEEFEINIFWRTKIGIVQERTGSKDPVQVLGALREMKDKKVSLANK
jgi:hydroxyacylglutathione hydrolase